MTLAFFGTAHITCYYIHPKRYFFDKNSVNHPPALPDVLTTIHGQLLKPYTIPSSQNGPTNIQKHT